MRRWLHNDVTFNPRPVVVVEDSGDDALELCEELERRHRDWSSLSTVLLLDGPGLDTERMTVKMLLKYPGLQVVTQRYQQPLENELQRISSAYIGDSFLIRDVQELLRMYPSSTKGIHLRHKECPAEAVSDHTLFVRLLDELLRPGGVAVCDIELTPLVFPFGNERTQIYNGLHAASVACRLQGDADEGVCVQDRGKLIVISAREKFSVGVPRALREAGGCCRCL
jgi:hypothetical protein